MSNRKHLPSLFWPLSPSVQPSRPSALFKMQVHCWLVLILTSHLNLRWFLAELLLKQVLPSVYWDMGNPEPLPELQELSMAQPPGLSKSLPFVSHSGIQSSKGRFPFMVEGCTIWLHYFKNLNGNITLLTVGLTQLSFLFRSKEHHETTFYDRDWWYTVFPHLSFCQTLQKLTPAPLAWDLFHLQASQAQKPQWQTPFPHIWRIRPS